MNQWKGCDVCDRVTGDGNCQNQWKGCDVCDRVTGDGNCQNFSLKFWRAVVFKDSYWRVIDCQNCSLGWAIGEALVRMVYWKWMGNSVRKLYIYLS